MFDINIDVSVRLSVSLLLVSVVITIIISSLPFADTSKAYLLENFIGGSILRGIINKCCQLVTEKR